MRLGFFTGTGTFPLRSPAFGRGRCGTRLRAAPGNDERLARAGPEASGGDHQVGYQDSTSVNITKTVRELGPTGIDSTELL